MELQTLDAVLMVRLKQKDLMERDVKVVRRPNLGVALTNSLLPPVLILLVVTVLLQNLAAVPMESAKLSVLTLRAAQKNQEKLVKNQRMLAKETSSVFSGSLT